VIRPLYRIRDFALHYSVADSRKLKGPWRWVPLPTRHDTKGYRRLVRKPNGMALYGIWCGLLAVSVKCFPPGTLQDADGPLVAVDIADKIGAPVELVEQLLVLLADPTEGINWLEVVTSTVNDVNASGDFRLATGKNRLPDKPDQTSQTSKPDKPEASGSEKPRVAKKKSGSVFDWINSEDLRDIGKLIEWHRKVSQARNPVVSKTEQDRLNVVAAAVKCWDKADDPVKLFAWIVGRKRWDFISQEHEDTAHQLIKQYLSGGAAPAARKGGTSTSGEIINELFPDLEVPV